MIKLINRPAFAFLFLFCAMMICTSIDVNASQRVFPFSKSGTHPNLNLKDNELSCWINSDSKKFSMPWRRCATHINQMLGLYFKMPNIKTNQNNIKLKSCSLQKVISASYRHYFVFGCPSNFQNVQIALSQEYHHQPYWWNF